MKIVVTSILLMFLLSGFPRIPELEKQSQYDWIIGDGQELPGERWNLRLNSDLDFRTTREFLKEIESQPVKYLPQIDTWLAVSEQEYSAQRLCELEQDPRIEWVERDGILKASEIVPNDPFYLPQQENLRVIGLGDAWLFSRGSSNWPIAIIDSGIDFDHPDLAEKIWINRDEIPGNNLDDDANSFIDDYEGWNFVADHAIPQDDYSHGSHAAGIAAAATYNQTGIAGIAWSTPIMVLKVLDRANSTGSYFFSSGTSMSTPHASGVAALVWALHPDWSSVEVSQILTSTAKDVWSGGRDELTGWGRIDASAAIRDSLLIQFWPLMLNTPE